LLRMVATHETRMQRMGKWLSNSNEHACQTRFSFPFALGILMRSTTEFAFSDIRALLHFPPKSSPRISRRLGCDRGQHRLAVPAGASHCGAKVRIDHPSGSRLSAQIERTDFPGTPGLRCVLPVANRAMVRVSHRDHGQSSGTLL